MPRNNFKAKGGKHAAKIAHLRLSDPQKQNLHEILEKPIAYVHDQRFRKPTIMTPIMSQDIEIAPGTTLGSQEEQVLFLHLNYNRYKLGQIRRKLLRTAKWTKKNAKWACF